MKSPAIVTVGLVIAFGAGLLGRQVRDAANATLGPPPPGTAAIAGIVTTADANPAPLRRAIVVLSAADASIDRSVVSDDGGRFAFDRLPSGRYTLTASKPAYVSTPYGAKRPGGTGTPVALSNGQRLRDLTIALARGGVISGVIRTIEGRANAGVQMSVFRLDQLPIRQDGLLGASDQLVTNDRGEYRAFGLAPGEYIVAGLGTAPGYGGLAARRDEEVDALLKELEQRSATARVAGSLARSMAQPPALSADQPRMLTLAPTYYPGTPSPADAVHVTVAAGTERSGVDFIVAPVPVVTVEGTVIGVNPGEGVILAISNGSEAAFGLSPVTPTPRLVVRPSAEGSRGRFVYTNVTPGRYLISAKTMPAAPSAVAGRAAGGGSVSVAPPSADLLWAIADVPVDGFDVTGVTLALQPGMTFAGRFAFEGAGDLAPKNLTAFRVQLDPAPGSRLRPMGGGTIGGTNIGLPARSAYAVVSADGTFAVRGLLPGPYQLAITIPNWRLHSAIAGGRELLDAPLEIQAGASITDATLTFTDRHSELGGRLQTPSGAAAPDYTVIVFPADRALWASPRRVTSTRPASDGRFAFPDLPAGEYLLAALIDVAAGEWTKPAFLEQVVPATVRVTLGDAERKQQNLQLGR